MDTKTHGNNDNIDVTLLNMVDNNCIKYSQRDYSKAVLACKIQKIIGQPSTQAYITIIEKNLLLNCLITKDDILAAEHIFGPARY
jgi:hypothetical protein